VRLNIQDITASKLANLALSVFAMDAEVWSACFLEYGGVNSIFFLEEILGRTPTNNIQDKQPVGQIHLSVRNTAVKAFAVKPYISCQLLRFVARMKTESEINLRSSTRSPS